MGKIIVPIHKEGEFYRIDFQPLGESWNEAFWQSLAHNDRIMFIGHELDPSAFAERERELYRLPISTDRIILADPDTNQLELIEVPPVLSKAWIGDPDNPRDLAELAGFIQNEHPRKHCLIRLLVHLHENSQATFNDLREHVHEGYPADDETIKGNIKEARAFIRLYKIPVRLSVSGFTVSRKYISVWPD